MDTTPCYDVCVINTNITILHCVTVTPTKMALGAEGLFSRFPYASRLDHFLTHAKYGCPMLQRKHCPYDGRVWLLSRWRLFVDDDQVGIICSKTVARRFFFIPYDCLYSNEWSHQSHKRHHWYNLFCDISHSNRCYHQFRTNEWYYLLIYVITLVHIEWVISPTEFIKLIELYIAPIRIGQKSHFMSSRWIKSISPIVKLLSLRFLAMLDKHN